MQILFLLACDGTSQYPITTYKLGILLIGFVYAGLLPYTVRKTVLNIGFDLRNETLSFLSNKSLYARKYVRGYKRLLFVTAILTYVYFWLLSKFYGLGKNGFFLQLINYSFVFLTLLAFVPHNTIPYSKKAIWPTVQRLVHNILAVLVFITLSALIIIFQVGILPDMYFLGVSGLTILSVMILITAILSIRYGISGITEIIFINGISIWGVYVTIMTFIR